MDVIHESAVLVQQQGPPAMAGLEVSEVVGAHLLQEGQRPPTADGQHPRLVSGLLTGEAVVRVSATAGGGFGVGLGGQRRHLAPDLFQDVHVYLAAWQFTDQAHVAVRLDILENAGDQLSQLFHLGLAHPSLADPGRAQADAHTQSGQLIAGDGISVGHQPA